MSFFERVTNWLGGWNSPSKSDEQIAALRQDMHVAANHLQAHIARVEKQQMKQSEQTIKELKKVNQKLSSMADVIAKAAGR